MKGVVVTDNPASSGHAAGRRALMEAEYHLRAVAADAMTRGLPEDQAEHEAVSRFGPPALVARKRRVAVAAMKQSGGGYDYSLAAAR